MKLVTLLTAILVFTASGINAQTGIIADFEDFDLQGAAFYNGSDFAGDFQSQGVTFANAFTDWGGGFVSWDGFSVSQATDNTTPGFGNQYSSFTGGAYSGTQYAIATTGFVPAVVTLPEPRIVEGAFITNTTYVGMALQGDDGNEFPFVREFGDNPDNGLGDGNEGQPDFFKLTITGLNAFGNPIGDPIEFMLADFTAADNADDYIVDAWQWVDMSSLGTVWGVSFTQSSTDVGDFGMNTPAYFAIDDFTVSATPEPTGLAILLAVTSCTLLKRN